MDPKIGSHFLMDLADTLQGRLGRHARVGVLNDNDQMAVFYAWDRVDCGAMLYSDEENARIAGTRPIRDDPASYDLESLRKPGHLMGSEADFLFRVDKTTKGFTGKSQRTKKSLSLV